MYTYWYYIKVYLQYWNYVVVYHVSNISIISWYRVLIHFGGRGLVLICELSSLPDENRCSMILFVYLYYESYVYHLYFTIIHYMCPCLLLFL